MADEAGRLVGERAAGGGLELGLGAQAVDQARTSSTWPTSPWPITRVSPPLPWPWSAVAACRPST